MAEDIAPKLLSSVQRAFKSGLKSRGVGNVKEVKELAKKGNFSLHNYSRKVGDSLSDAYLKTIIAESLPEETFYYNIANKVIRPTMSEAYDLVSDVADAGQLAKNQSIGIGLKPIRPPIEEERLAGLIDVLTRGDFDQTRIYLNEAVKNLVDHFADHHVQKNAEFLENTGVSVTVTRTAEAMCCQWCSDRAGVYNGYEEAQKNEVFARHEGCRCDIELSSSRGSGKMRAVGHAFVRT